MSWIKMRTDLRDHPKVVRMASALKADRLRIIGGLWAVWGTFDTHSVDGALEGYTLSSLDEGIGWKGFSAAMAAVRWLNEIEAGLEIPEFDEHNGASAKRRATDAKRKKDGREEDKTYGGSWTQEGQMSASDADKTQTRVREEKEKKKPTVSKGAKAPTFDAATIELPEWLEPEDWHRWVTDRAARKKAITEEGAKSQLRKLDDFRRQGHSAASVIEHSIAGGYQGLFAPGKSNGHAEPDTAALAADVRKRLGIGPAKHEVIDA